MSRGSRCDFHLQFEGVDSNPTANPHNLRRKRPWIITPATACPGNDSQGERISGFGPGVITLATGCVAEGILPRAGDDFKEKSGAPKEVEVGKWPPCCCCCCCWAMTKLLSGGSEKSETLSAVQVMGLRAKYIGLTFAIGRRAQQV